MQLIYNIWMGFLRFKCHILYILAILRHPFCDRRLRSIAVGKFVFTVMICNNVDVIHVFFVL
mgnify:CR=1 FL=1